MKTEIMLISLVLVLLLLSNFKIIALEKIKNNLIIIVFILLPPIFNTSGIYIEGIDNYVYNLFYRRLLNGIDSVHGDFGFDFFSKVLASLQVSPFLFFLIISALQIYIMSWFTKKYSTNWKISFSLYIFLMYFVNNFNGIRQGLALSIIIIFLDRLIDKKYIISIIYLFIGISVHFTSILIVFFVLISYKKYIRKNKLIIIFCLSQLFGKNINLLLGRIFPLFISGKYFSYTAHSFFMNYRFTLFYFIYLLFLTLMVYWMIKTKEKLFEPKNKIDNDNVFFTRVLYHGTIFMLITSSFVIIRRLNIYFMFLYPIVLVNIFRESRYKSLVYLINLIVFFVVSLF